MKIYSSQYNMVAQELIANLLKAGLIDVEKENIREAELDVIGVLKEYRRMERTITEQARDLTAGDGSGAENRMKRRLAKEKNFKLGDDGFEYVVNQIIETFLVSSFVEEIYGTDRELRKHISSALRKYSGDRTEELDKEVRSKLKNLKEGSTAWDVEYERMMDRVKRKKGLSDEG